MIMSGSDKKLFGVIVCDSQAKWGGPEGIAQRIKHLMATDGEEWKTFNAEQGELPTDQDLETFQGFYITGSDSSVHDNTPWIQKLESFIRQAYHLKKPKVYGTCFGHQAIGKALGGKVMKNPSDTIVCNNETIVLCESKSDSSFLKDIQKISERKPFRMLVCHGECVSELPKNAERIASSESCVNEIVLYSENVIGVQSHADFYVEDLKDVIIPSLLERNLITKDEYDKVNKSLKLPNVCGDLAMAASNFLKS